MKKQSQFHNPTPKRGEKKKCRLVVGPGRKFFPAIWNVSPHSEMMAWPVTEMTSYQLIQVLTVHALTSTQTQQGRTLARQLLM